MLSKIINLIGTDKLLHGFVCYSIALTVGMFSLWHVGLTVAILMGAWKELYDRVTYTGTPSWYDFLADAVGAILGTLICIIL